MVIAFATRLADHLNRELKVRAKATRDASCDFAGSFK
jgi:hypothetical protein